MTFFDCTADLVGQLNGNDQKGMLQIDAPPVENFWLRHCMTGSGRETTDEERVSLLLYIVHCHSRHAVRMHFERFGALIGSSYQNDLAHSGRKARA